MHDNYTQANCKLECAIKYAQNMTGFNCTPWYLPTQDHPGLGFPARHITVYIDIFSILNSVEAEFLDSYNCTMMKAFNYTYSYHKIVAHGSKITSKLAL